MFTEERTSSKFSWKDLGSIETGRPDVGPMVPVLLYRLLQYTLRDVMITKFDVQTASEVFIEAGRIAGKEFCRNLLNTDLDFPEFLTDLKRVLDELKIGILTIESADFGCMELLISMSEDVSCSGLPVSHETVCSFDEGFIQGILDEYTSKEFTVKEIDCWANGDRVCRFKINIVKL